jgi:hypothetical protein
LGRCNNALRLPLLPLTPGGEAAVAMALQEAGVL